MNQLIFHPEAQDELFSAIGYYNEQTPGLGVIFFEEIERSINNINKNPKRWKICAKKVRQCIVPRFPFSIFYIYNSNTIYIVAIAHNKQNPNYWKESF